MVEHFVFVKICLIIVNILKNMNIFKKFVKIDFKSATCFRQLCCLQFCGFLRGCR
jgi:hypothetical protein